MTASDEGMPEIDASQDRRDDDHLDEVMQAKRELGGESTPRRPNNVGVHQPEDL